MVTSNIGETTSYHGSGTVLLINAFDTHSSQWTGMTNRYFFVCVDAEYWGDVLGVDGLDSTAARFNQPIIQDQIVFHLLVGLRSQIQSNPDSIGLDDIRNLLQTCYRRGHLTEVPLRDNRLPIEILRSAFEAHATSADDAETVRSIEDAAEELGISRYQLARLCRKEHGIEPRRLRLQLMVALAQLAIAEGAELVDAAERAGFSDQSHMNREFKRTLGMTPREYQVTHYLSRCESVMRHQN